MSEFMFTVGKEKRRVPASQMNVSDLEWYRDECRNATLRQRAIDELNRRANGGAVSKPVAATNRAPAPSRAIQPAQVTAMAPSAYANDVNDAITFLARQEPAALTAHLKALAENYILVTPTTSVDALPEGFGISVNYLTVNSDASPNGPGEVYKIADKLGLSGTTLSKIGAAAAVDWSPRESGRLDDGSDRRYVHFRAVGYVKNFDGTPRTITGEVEIDLRDRSDQVNEIIEKAKKRQDDPDYRGKRDNGASQLLEARKFILRHAERKAKNRAIADMGIKRSYTKAELDSKTVAVARLMWTGQSNDPELRRRFALMGAEQMLKSMSAAYGSAPALPTREVRQFEGHAPHAPPPVGAVADDGEVGDPEFVDAIGEEYDGPVPPDREAPAADKAAHGPNTAPAASADAPAAAAASR